MYVPGAPAWIEYGPQRPRPCGLGDVVTLSLPQLDQSANNPSWNGGSPSDVLGNSTLNDGAAFSFLSDPTASSLCVMGRDASNPNCLSAAGLALAAGGSTPKTAAAAAPSILSSPIALGVGLLFVVMLIGGKR